MKIEEITKKLNNFFTAINTKITKVMPMPAILLLCSAMNRPGLSALRSLTNVCKSLEDLGIPTRNNPDGTPNLTVAIIYALLTEVVRMQTEDAVVQGGIEAGAVSIVSQGANSGGPVISNGFNLLPIHTWGVIN